MTEGQDWLDLNGQWDFSFDPQDIGEAEAWYRPDASFERTIRVPFPWESHAAWGTEAAADCDNYFSRNAYLNPAEVNKDNYREAPRHTIGWYRRTFEVPEAWNGRRIILNIGAADWHVRLWVNGQAVGESESGYLPVEFDITDYLIAGENTVTCRVCDPQDDEQKPLGKQHAWYTTTSSIWQPVWLAPRPQAHVESIRLTPKPAEGAVLAEVICHNLPENGSVSVSVSDDEGKQVGEATLAADEAGAFHGSVALGEEARLWTPENPHLYGVIVALECGGESVDTAHSYFGMRQVGTGTLYEGGPNYLTLNGNPIYIKGALDQSFNPWGVYTYLSDEAIRKHLQQAKDAGFNLLRVHIKLEDPRYLYWADRLGVMLQCDLPNCGYGGYSELACRRHRAQLLGAIARDYNHPAIISWCLFNETWGLGGEEYKQDPQRQHWVEEMYELAKELDGTRLLEDNSACLQDHVRTDINSWHFYINDYEQAAEHIAAVADNTRPGSDFNFVPGRTQSGQPLLNSEYGGIAARMGDKDVSWCFKFLTDLLRRETRVCGYVYTELHDIEWERNGIYNYDGSAKQFGYDPADLQADPYFAFEGPPGETLEPGSTVRFPVFFARQGCTDLTWPDIEITVSGIDALGQELSPAPTGTINWPRGDAETNPALSCGAFAFDRPLPDYPCLLRLEARVNGRFSDFKYLEVCNGRLPATERLADGSLVLRKLAGEQEHSSGWHEAELERGLVGREIHLLGGIEAGHLDYRFELPEGMDLAAADGITLIAELSAKRQDARQTEACGWPSDLQISMNGVHIHSQRLGDQYADSRGALSHIHGFWGRYGELVRVRVAADMVQEMAGVDRRHVKLTLAVPRELTPGGLIVYSSRAGRYPLDLTLIISGCGD